MEIYLLFKSQELINQLTDCLFNLFPNHLNIYYFQNEHNCFEYLIKYKPFIVFLDSGQLDSMDGITFVETVNRYVTGINFIFLTDSKNNHSIIRAINARCSGYIITPFTIDAIKIELEHLRYSKEYETRN